MDWISTKEKLPIGGQTIVLAFSVGKIVSLDLIVVENVEGNLYVDLGAVFINLIIDGKRTDENFFWIPVPRKPELSKFKSF